MQKKFTVDTRDAIERLWGRRIVSKFPMYADFWESFIGYRRWNKQLPLKWYLYKYPSSITKVEKRKIKDKIEQIFMSHYSIFLELAGANHHLKKMKQSLKVKNNKQKIFLHWEAFNCFFQHLQNIGYQVFRLWRLLGELESGKAMNARNSLLIYLGRVRKKYLYLQFDKFFNRDNGQVSVIRNNIVHFSSRSFAWWEPGIGFTIPYKSKGNINWSWQQSRKPRVRQSTIKFSEGMLENIYNIVNSIHKEYINFYSDFLHRNKILIKY